MFDAFLNTLNWWQWSVLAAVPLAIIALYFLKLRREPLEVPSTYLWHKSIEDLHVNSLWQRLRRSLLLLLQLLFVLLLMLALLRPGWRGNQVGDDRMIFLVDRSASMSSTDVAPSRLEEAKRRVEQLIERSRPGCQMMIISFADTAEVVQEFTSSHRLLRERLRAIRPTARTTSLRQALQLAAGLANPGRTATDAGDQQVADAQPATLYIFSDGRFAAVDDFSLGHLKPVFVPIGRPGADNLAVTALSSQAVESEPGRRQVFARVANWSDQEATRMVELRVGGELLDAKEISIDAGGETEVMFDLQDVDEGSLSLGIDGADALALDNTGYAAIGTPRRARVLLVTPGNAALRWALSTRRVRQLADLQVVQPERLATPQYETDAASGAYDLIIYDQCRPAEMPQANTLFVGRTPPGKGWRTELDGQSEARVAVPQIIDTTQAHPLMRLVNMDDVLIGESVRLKPPEGSLVLIDSSEGPLSAIAPRGAFEDVVLAFELVHTSGDGETFNTNWPVGRLSFPTFMFNVVEYLGGAQQRQVLASVRPGQSIRLPSPGGGDVLDVVAPDGTVHRIARDRQGQFPFHDTQQVGIYQVRRDGETVQRFAVNLFSPAESQVRPVSEGAIQIGYVEIEGRPGWEPARRETWPLLLLAALAVLTTEWYIYNRRVAL